MSTPASAGCATRPWTSPFHPTGIHCSLCGHDRATRCKAGLSTPGDSMTAKIIQGKAYVLGDNVDTDQIIPAQYLTFNPAIAEEYKQFGKYALSSVPPAQAGLPKGHVPFHTTDEFVSDFKIIVGGKNFGCGSSREHAPIALDAAGIEAVVAEFYARIFFRNSVNGG